MKTKKKTRKTSSPYEPIGTKPKVGDRTVWHGTENEVQTIVSINEDGTIDGRGADGIRIPLMSNLYFFDSYHRRILKRKSKVTGPKVYRTKGLIVVIRGNKASYSAVGCGKDSDCLCGAWISEPAKESLAFMDDNGKKLVTGKLRKRYLSHVDGLGGTWRKPA